MFKRIFREIREIFFDVKIKESFWFKNNRYEKIQKSFQKEKKFW